MFLKKRLIHNRTILSSNVDRDFRITQTFKTKRHYKKIRRENGIIFDINSRKNNEERPSAKPFTAK